MSDVRELATAAVDVETVIRELAAAGGLRAKQLLVLGVSTSEILGQRIGTSGTLDAAQAIYAGMEAAAARYRVSSGVSMLRAFEPSACDGSAEAAEQSA